MEIYFSNNCNPHFNQSTEEYFLKFKDSSFLIIYINDPTVVVGKHQIVPKEINSQFVNDSNIYISRRLSGGGTVYHDCGNINFSFIQSFSSNENISFHKIIDPLYQFLKTYNVRIDHSKRNDLSIDNKKISGSALHVYKNRVIAHCTLLVTSNLDNLRNCLSKDKSKYIDKSIASIPSQVGNLSDFIPDITVEKVISDLDNHFVSEKNNIKICYLDQNEMITINDLCEKKYKTYEWIYGHSPVYDLKSRTIIKSKIIDYQIKVEKGMIASIQFENNTSDDSDLKLIEDLLINNKHEINQINSINGLKKSLGKEYNTFIKSLF